MEFSLLKEGEEIDWFKKVKPGLTAEDNLRTHLNTTAELLQHHLTSGVGHVECGVLLRIGWSDDWHQVIPVRRVYLGEQHKTEIQRQVKWKLT